MKIAYLANIRFPSERAHSIQAVEMCQALSEVGHEVTLVVPKSRINNSTNVGEEYSLEQKFLVKRIGRIFKTFNFIVGSKFQTVLFSIHILFFLLKNREYEIIYVKDERIVFPLTFLNKKIVWEPHVGDLSFDGRRLAKKAVAIIALTDGVKNAFIGKSVDSKKIMVAHDAVRFDMFASTLDKTKLRSDLGLPENKKIVMYVGHLFTWKGVDVLAEAARNFSEDTVCVFIGGLPHDIEVFRSKYGNQKNILVLGNKSRKEVPRYLQGADILVLPNSGKVEISRSYTSPLKLFEYMASRRPIVASDLPSLREVLNEQNAYFVAADDSTALSSMINNLDLDSLDVKERVDRSFSLVSENTWYNRAQRVTQFIKQKIHGHITR